MKCPKCNYENKEEALSCGLCSALLKEKPAPVAPATGTAGQFGGGKTCPNHWDRPAGAVCASCGKEFCSECVKVTTGKPLCPACQSQGSVQPTFNAVSTADGLKGWWILIGIGLVINYFIPMLTVMDNSVMMWSMFQASFLIGFTFLLPALCGVVLVVMSVSGRGMARGLIISLASLVTIGFFMAMVKISPEHHDIYWVVWDISFILILVASRLRVNYERSDTTRLFGGIVGLIFLVVTLILVIRTLSSPEEKLFWSITFGEPDRLSTLTLIIFIGCLLGFIASGILSVVNFARLPRSQALAHYGFKIGIISLIVLVGWILLLPVISGCGAAASFLIDRLVFMAGSVLFMLGTGTYDWLKRLMPKT